ncbi:MAG: DUF192 domain-containing protein [Stappiaceae bacterium]
MMRLIGVAFFSLLLTFRALAVEFGSPEDLTVETGLGTFPLSIEVADDSAKRAQGLMNRKSLPSGYGMLFDFGREQDVHFWMKNTYVPLDMIFIKTDGTVAAIRKNTEPLSEKAISSGVPVRFVLEVEAGVANQMGLKSGDKVRHPRMSTTP